jgi:periplasmic divalent cation tolerance protein
MTSEQIYLAYCTCPSEESALSIAETLVREDLAACVNILPGVSSVYRWKGQVETATEVLMMIKSSESRVAAIIDRITELHPYEVPEVICNAITAGQKSYLDWVRECTANIT